MCLTTYLCLSKNEQQYATKHSLNSVKKSLLIALRDDYLYHIMVYPYHVKIISVCILMQQKHFHVSVNFGIIRSNKVRHRLQPLWPQWLLS